MDQTLRILLVAGAAVTGGVLVNLLLLFIFRNKQFIQGIRVLQKFGRKVSNPWEEQTNAYDSLRQAVETLQTAEKPEKGQRKPSEMPPDPSS